MRWLWVTSVALAVGVAAILAASSSPQPSQGLLVAAPAMSASRAAHTATAVADGRVRRGNLTLLASAEIYDSAAGVFSRTGDMLVRRHKHDGVLLRDGQVLVTGGSDEQDDRGQYHSSELFDPKTARFESGPAMRLTRYKHAGSSVLLPSGLVLVAGGAPQAEVFDPGNRTFTLVPGEPRMAGQFSAVALLETGGALITGGYGNGGGPRSSTWLYRP